MKAIFNVAFVVGWRRGQFAHHDDQIFLRREDLIAKELIARNGPSQSERRVQFVNAP